MPGFVHTEDDWTTAWAAYNDKEKEIKDKWDALTAEQKENITDDQDFDHEGRLKEIQDDLPSAGDRSYEDYKALEEAKSELDEHLTELNDCIDALP